jgi:hypothetical protein
VSASNHSEQIERPELAKSVRPTFAHRKNSENTFDSICTKCFAKIATSSDEADLEAAEESHVCPGFNLGQVMRPGEPKATEK